MSDKQRRKKLAKHATELARAAVQLHANQSKRIRLAWKILRIADGRARI